MTKNKAVDIVPKIVSLLETLESVDRQRVITAVLTLLGESVQTLSVQPLLTHGFPAKPLNSDQASEKKFFDIKQPSAKIEEIAVAARYREESEQATSSTKADLQKVFRSARRNFDSHNFHRDMANARTAGLFNRDTGKDSFELSHYGQSFVDALPDRTALKQLRRPKRARRVAKNKSGKQKR
jgi:hypothetical protein